MSTLELPHTPNCLVCGPANPHGLKLSLHINPQTGIVSVTYTPQPDHIGFEGIVHGGILATVLDEAMVWAATWSIKNFCVCGDLSTRFRLGAAVGQPLTITAQVESSRKRLIETTAQIHSPEGLVATATGKYIPVSPERNEQFMQTLIDQPQTHAAAALLTRGIPLDKDD
jgi:acyl-coenzyme A thioesterase PaaI-like protein